MRVFKLPWALLSVLASSLVLDAYAHSRTQSSGPTHRRHRRAVLPEGAQLDADTYDFVICGGGLAGLVLANRLTELPDVTVAVIEAGESGYDTTQFNTPAATFYDTAAGTKYDWAYKTVPQSNLDGAARPVARGKTLGGSSAINGLYMVRGNDIQYDSWASLNNASDWWGWPNIKKYMMKAEYWTPPPPNFRDWITFFDGSHGNAGPINQTWPAVSYPIVKDYLQSWEDYGAPRNPDPYRGDNTGVFVAMADINPTNWTRSFARTGYLDPIMERPNLHVVTGHQCTKILMSSDKDGTRATGVQYQSGADSQALTVNANKEVIVAGGAIGSPQLLQLSGIGPSAHLSKVGVDTVLDLPGVGYGFSDHISAPVDFHPKADTVLPPSALKGDPEVDSYINTATCYVNMTMLLDGKEKRFIQTLIDDMDNIVDSYKAPPEVLKGYRAIINETIVLYNRSTLMMELLFASTWGGITINVALQTPLSRGSVLIDSRDPFASPLIDPGWLSVGHDLHLYRAGFTLARRVGQQQNFTKYHDGETKRTVDIDDSDPANWDALIKAHSGTEYHPQSSCAMLPLELGGVVGPDLLVHGTTNLRVIDSSIPPAPLATHCE